MIETTRPFTPDWVSPPGDTIADVLEERDWTQIELAERLGYSTKFISQLINGKAPINEETALKLERVLGSTAAFWLRREAQFRLQRQRFSCCVWCCVDSVVLYTFILLPFSLLAFT